MDERKLNVEDFLTDYFTAHHCELTHSTNTLLTVQLTENLDKKLMNRPFYWQYITSTGRAGEPMKLSFKFTNQDEAEEGEWIHFGSPRLQHIFNDLQKSAKYTQLFEQMNVTSNTALHPWLVTNIIVRFTGKQVKEKLFSLGLNLINGALRENMMDILEDKQFDRTISDYCHIISPLIKLQAGYNRIDAYLHHYLKDLNYQWANESERLLNEEIEMIHHFYQDKESELMENELQDVTDRLRPQITFEIVNGGMFYLDSEQQ